MAKDVSGSVRDSLSQALTSITQGMTAPDALPLMPMLNKLHGAILGLIQQGHQQPGMPPPGGGGPGAGGPPPGQGGPPPGGQYGPPPGQAPGPPPAPMANAGGQGVFPNSPQPNAQELQQLMAAHAGA